MAQEFKYTSIILGKKDIGEVDRLYFLYTLERGLVKVIGKGVRRSSARLAGNLETGNMAEVFVSQGRGKGSITGVVPSENFSILRDDPDTVLGLFKIFSRFMRLVQEGEKDERVFRLLLDLMSSLNKEGIQSEKRRLLLLGFNFKLLGGLGYRMEAERCVRCGGSLLPEGNRFDVSDGGVVCPGCAVGRGSEIPIGREGIKLIRIFLANRIGSLEKVVVSERELRSLETISQRLFSWIMD